MDEFIKFNTVLLDNIISSLEIIKQYQITSPAGLCTVNPVQLADLSLKIATLKRIRDEFKIMYEKHQRDTKKIIESINND